MSRPAALSWRALVETAMVAEGWIRFKLSAMKPMAAGLPLSRSARTPRANGADTSLRTAQHQYVGAFPGSGRPVRAGPSPLGHSPAVPYVNQKNTMQSPQSRPHTCHRGGCSLDSCKGRVLRRIWQQGQGRGQTETRKRGFREMSISGPFRMILRTAGDALIGLVLFLMFALAISAYERTSVATHRLGDLLAVSSSAGDLLKFSLDDSPLIAAAVVATAVPVPQPGPRAGCRAPTGRRPTCCSRASFPGSSRSTWRSSDTFAASTPPRGEVRGGARGPVQRPGLRAGRGPGPVRRDAADRGWPAGRPGRVAGPADPVLGRPGPVLVRRRRAADPVAGLAQRRLRPRDGRDLRDPPRPHRRRPVARVRRPAVAAGPAEGRDRRPGPCRGWAGDPGRRRRRRAGGDHRGARWPTAGRGSTLLETRRGWAGWPRRSAAAS